MYPDTLLVEDTLEYKAAFQSTVLIVEDDLDTSKFISLSLRDTFSIITAKDGKEGLEKAIEHKPDLILSDFFMPNMTGIELLRQIRKIKEFNIIPVIILTTNASKELRLQALLEGAQDCLIKPFSQEELKAKVKTLINLKVAKFVLLNQKIKMEANADLNRIKNEFLANMSHELRTPLNAIIGFTELMHSEKLGPVSAEYKEFLNDILTSSFHLLQLINQILDLTKIESGKITFKLEKINFHALVQEIKDTFYVLALKKNITLNIVISSSLTEIIQDSEKLKCVFYNYISNAIKFTPSSGHINVSISPVSLDTFRIEVKDTGVGIQKQDLKKLFVEFQQLDNSLSKQYQGTGLGLALTKHIVEAMGGKVGVESVLGVGTTFYAILPIKLNPTF